MMVSVYLIHTSICYFYIPFFLQNTKLKEKKISKLKKIHNLTFALFYKNRIRKIENDK